MANASGENEDQGLPGGSARSEPMSGAGAGAAAIEEVNLTEEEGLYTQHARATFTFGEWINIGVAFTMSSTVIIVVIAAIVDGLLGLLVWAMRNQPYAIWLIVGSAVLAVAILAGAGWFAYHLSMNEKQPNRKTTVIRGTAKPSLVTGNKTILAKRKRCASKKRRRGRRN